MCSHPNRIAATILLLISATLFNATLFPGASWANTVWELTGGEDFLREQIRLRLDQLNGLKGYSSDQRRRGIDRAIMTPAHALGYFQLAYTLDETGKDRYRITLEPGDRVMWQRVSLSLTGAGEHEPSLNQTILNPPLRAGTGLNQSHYEQLKTQWLNQARSIGYRDAHYVEQRLAVDRQALAAHATLKMDTGLPYFLGTIHFTESRLDPDYLRRLLKAPSGARFNTQSLSRFYSTLLNSGYFHKVEIDTEDQPEQRIDLHVLLEDAPRHTYTTGIGFSTDSGPRIRLGWDRPAINDMGHRLNNEFRGSELNKTLSSEYRIPIGNPVDDYLAFKVGWKQETIDGNDTTLLQTTATRNRLNPDTLWQHTYQVGIEKEDYTQGGQTENLSFYVIPAASWSRTIVKGSPRLPDSGYKVWFSLDGSTVLLGSDTDFLRAVAGYRWLQLYADVHELTARIEAGAIISEEFEDVPFTRRFRTGGDQSVRGYRYQSISPEDADGEPTGATTLLVGSLEYRWRWREQWHLAVFTDSGSAFNSAGDKFRYSFGVGLHWMSPIGAVRFDIAAPQQDDSVNTFRIHVSMGPTL